LIVRDSLGCDRYLPIRLQLPDEWSDVLAEIFDLFLEMQEGEEDEVGTRALKPHDALGDLRGRSDQVGAKTVVVLNEILETGLGLIALAFR
jgi:hypothetical protein